ncbi:hypothetical protein ON010_g11493 [Phytophthora cinnamomi]|nr:hypothetical protein ON010_g11493 [Phytophthora cinnamomi]
MPARGRKRRILSAVRKLWKSALDEQMDDSDGSSSADEEQGEVAAIYFVLKAKRNDISRLVIEFRVPPQGFNCTSETCRLGVQAPFSVVSPIEYVGEAGKDERGATSNGPAEDTGLVGHEGHSADFLSVGGHTPDDLLSKRTICALNSLRSKVIMWPGAEERREISEQILGATTSPHCIGMIDGTLFPLLTRPQDHGEDYYSRKASYPSSGLVVCDVLVPALNTSQGGQLDVKQTYFNKCLAKIWIRVKRCIGMLECRFPLLRRQREPLILLGSLSRSHSYAASVLLRVTATLTPSGRQQYSIAAPGRPPQLTPAPSRSPRSVHAGVASSARSTDASVNASSSSFS